MQSPPVVLGTGLITLDIVLASQSGTQARMFAGGTCGNVLAVLAFLEWRSYPIARFNTDSAAMNVTADLARWNVKDDFMNLEPSADTPIIVQEIKLNRSGETYHTFSWTCPHCGAWLPSYRAVRIDSVESILDALPTPSVFFFDRVSPAALRLAEHCANEGAIVFFEPSGASNIKHFKRALELSHVVKYAESRAREFKNMIASANPLLEIETLGSAGVRYRSSRGRASKGVWISVPSIPTMLMDAAGAGDWFTAGFLNTVGRDGLPGLKDLSARNLAVGIRKAQAYASWACRFEGPRGGMYEQSKERFEGDIEALLSKKSLAAATHNPAGEFVQGKTFECPTCISVEGVGR